MEKTMGYFPGYDMMPDYKDDPGYYADCRCGDCPTCNGRERKAKHDAEQRRVDADMREVDRYMREQAKAAAEAAGRWDRDDD